MTCYDAFHRSIDYLRVSVTDRCNLRCVYCMPPQGVPLRPHEEILTYEEIELIVRAAVGLGIRRVRLTGGEPLVRLDIVELVRALRAIPGLEDLSMTTNGILLPRYAQALAEAGLDRVNISLDTLRPERFHKITRLGRLEDVLAGIEAAHAAGLEPVKINFVAVRNLNDDEIVDFARQTREQGWHVRFIEFMPVGIWSANDEAWKRDGFLPVRVIRQRIESALGELIPYPGPASQTDFATGVSSSVRLLGGGPARYYRLPGATGTIGFISAVSQHFCATCNRLRLTADGRLRPCLLSDIELDIRAPLRAGATLEQVQELLRRAVALKPAGHRLSEGLSPHRRTMSQIGG